MSYYKIPILEKIYEAYSAIADNRVKLLADKTLVTSSDNAKTYTIVFDGETYISNDNMSYFKQTIGYPIIATMMLKNELVYNNDVAKLFANINWKKINTEHKNNYVLTASLILDELKNKGENINLIKEETQRVYNQIKLLRFEYKKSKDFPPKAN